MFLKTAFSVLSTWFLFSILRRSKLAKVAVLLFFTASLWAGNGVEGLKERIEKSTPHPVLSDPKSPGEGIWIEGKWNQGIWSGVVRNETDHPVAIHEIVLFELDHGLDSQTPVYGESFQMLAQINGTLKSPMDMGMYPDRKHYRIPEPEGYRAASGLLALFPGQDQAIALAFTSCNKFLGRIGFNQNRLKAFIETEDLPLPPHGSWPLESFGCFIGNNRAVVLQSVAVEIQKNHPRNLSSKPPTGWCSWYTFYEGVTMADIQNNLGFAKKKLPQIRYIQIDDGYQSKMGDWLETGTAFGGDIHEVLRQIKQAGFEPAIWVAPFIAEKDSKILKDHPDWFIQGPDGKPLDSSTVGFGGWRCAPWYVLDGTHPEVQAHFENVFKTMREEWGVTYFKLDANYWGAIHGGKLHDPNATRIDAYREGMKAIQKGAGNSFILGCNAPIWPSLGLVDGMRTSGDINQIWSWFKSSGLENLSRSWQNGRLWWSDPDCVLLTETPQINIRKHLPRADPSLTEKEFKLHVAAIRATGGLVLSGDDLTQIKPERLKLLEKLFASTGKAMSFDKLDFSVGRVQISEKKEEVALFNWGNQPVSRSIPFDPGSKVTDFWTGEAKRVADTSLSFKIPARSAVLLEIEKK